MMHYLWGNYGWNGAYQGGATWGLVAGILMLVFMITFWVLIIWGLIVLIRWVSELTKRGGRRDGESSLEVLKKRYARGEIDKREFEEIKKDID